jgi:hypothetical protein
MMDDSIHLRRDINTKLMLALDDNEKNPDDRNNDNNVDNDNATDGEDRSTSSVPSDQDQPQLPGVLPVVALTLAFVSLWPLLAVLRVGLSGMAMGGSGGTGTVTEFDVDAYMALKGIMDSGSSSPDDSISAMRSSEIFELPQLSPAEKIVGAFFGPPSSR